MKLKSLGLILVLLVFFSPKPILAQSVGKIQKNKPVVSKGESTQKLIIEFGLNDNVMLSDFFTTEQRHSEHYPGITVSASKEWSRLHFNTSTQYIAGNISAISFSNQVNYKVVETKTTQTLLGINYFFCNQNENIYDEPFPQVRIDGLTTKQKLLFSVSENFFTKAGKIRVSFLFGGVRLEQKASFRVNGHLINDNHNDIFENVMFFPENNFVHGIGILFTSQPLKRFIFSIDTENLFVQKNRTHLMPTHQHQSGIEIRHPLSSMFTISLRGLLSNMERRTITLPSGLKLNVVAKF
jgi:hypothetical protein